MRLVIQFVVCAWIVLGPVGVWAQTPQETAATPAASTSERADQLAVWAAALDRIDADLDQQQLTLDTLANLRDSVVTVRDQIQVVVDELTPQLEDQRALLQGLAPDDGELVETPEIEAQRERIRVLETDLQPAELLLGRANTLREQIVTRRSEEFTKRLFERSLSIVAPRLWIDGLSNLPRIANRFSTLVASSAATVQARATSATLISLLVFAAILVVATVPLRRLALRKAARVDGYDPSGLEKTLGAVRIVVVSTVIPAVAFLLVFAGLELVGGFPLRSHVIFNAIALNTVLFFLVSGFVRAFLAPGLPNWRLVPVADGYAAKAAVLFRFAVLIYAIGEIAKTIAGVFFAPLITVQFLETLPTLLAGLSILAGLRSVLQGLPVTPDHETPPISHILWRWTVPVAGVCALAALIAQVAGFLALAAFLVDRLVWTSVVLAALHLSARLVEGLTSVTLQEQTRTAGWLHDNVGLSRTGLGQFGVLLSGLIKLLLILAAASFIIAPFGIETGEFATIFSRVFTGIEIGGFSFSLTSIFVAIAMIAIGVIVTRAIQGWLENRYLPKTTIDAGLKASIRTAVGYIGVIAAVVVGLSYLGLNLENVALVAGALSVGIGFGLQSIVSNFVSGLILLAERPFKQGDWVVVGDEQGIVKRINVRATEIQTFDRATVLIPNQDFIAGTVKNRVHRDTMGRIDVPVGVGYDSDPEQVKAILLDVANAHPQTLSYPEPAAFFVEFGASSLDFMLFAYLADVGNGYGVRSDIRFEIFKRFKQAGIEIPFAQSDVTIRNLDQITAVLAQSGLALPDSIGSGGLAPDAGQKMAGVSTVPAPPDPRVDRTVDDDPDAMPGDGPVGR